MPEDPAHPPKTVVVQTFHLNTTSDLSTTLREQLPMLAEKFYANLATHVGADAAGRTIGPEILRDVDTHVGQMNPMAGGGVGMRILPQHRPKGLAPGAFDPSMDGFLAAVVDGTMAKALGIEPPPDDVRENYATARRRLGMPRVPGVLRIVIVSTQDALVLDVPRPSPLDQEPEVRAIDIPASGGPRGDA